MLKNVDKNQKSPDCNSDRKYHMLTRLLHFTACSHISDL